MMILGCSPYGNTSTDDLLTAIENHSIDYLKNSHYDKLSSNVRELLSMMLNKDATARPTVKECLEHKVFKDSVKSSNSEIDQGSLNRFLNSMNLHWDKLQRKSMKYLARIYSNHDMKKKAENLFLSIDSCRQGYITKASLATFLET